MVYQYFLYSNTISEIYRHTPLSGRPTSECDTLRIVEQLFVDLAIQPRKDLCVLKICFFFPITECMHDFSNCSELQPARKQLCKYSPEAAQQSNQDFGDSLVFPVCSGPKLGGYSSRSFPKWPLAKKKTWLFPISLDAVS